MLDCPSSIYTILVEPNLDEYYDEEQMQFTTLVEERMTNLKKDSRIRAKMYVFPELINDFLKVACEAYYEEKEEGYNLCEKIGLSRKHVLAILDKEDEISGDIRQEIEESINVRRMEEDERDY